MNETDLQGKVAMITGAASGLGEVVSSAFGAAGCCVACLDVNGAGAERVAGALMARDVDAVALTCDVSSEQAVADAVARVAERFGRVDIVVNNAAVDHTVSVHEMTVAQWDQVCGVNLRGPFLLAKAAWPYMQQRGYGHIFNIASTAVTRAWANAAAYHATKWGLVGFSRGLGVEGRASGIRVTTVIPGGMRTHFFDRFVEQGIPMPDESNLQDPANVAAALVFAARMPPGSAIQELIITPVTETSWP